MIVAAGRGVAGSPDMAGIYPDRSAPLRYPAEPVSAGTTETKQKQLWVCTSCGFIYDPDEGDPDGGIAPGTAFEDIPDNWFCPVCGARKADFEPYEE